MPCIFFFFNGGRLRSALSSLADYSRRIVLPIRINSLSFTVQGFPTRIDQTSGGEKLPTGTAGRSAGSVQQQPEVGRARPRCDSAEPSPPRHTPPLAAQTLPAHKRGSRAFTAYGHTRENGLTHTVYEPRQWLDWDRGWGQGYRLQHFLFGIVHKSLKKHIIKKERKR